MTKEIEIPEGYEAKIVGNKVVLEPKESEEERIRKDIVKYLTNELNNVEQLTPRTNEYERWITWLSLKFRVGDTISFKSKQYTIVGIDFDNHCYDLNDDECVDFDTAHYQFTLEKQKEQKPAEWSEEDKRLLRTTLECLNYISCQSKTPVVNWLNSLPERFNLQPKQEWSEEEEKYRKILLLALNDHPLRTDELAAFNWLKSLPLSLKKRNEDVAKLYSNEWSEEDEKKIVELKTFIAKCNGFNKSNRQKAFELIDSLRPQPMQEWSEEDEKIVADFLYGINVGFTQKAAKDRAKDILSLLHPQPHWKPSEEQME